MIERWIKIVAVVLLLLMNVFTGWMFTDDDPVRISLRLVVTLTSLILQWEIAHVIIKYGRKKYPRLQDVRKRVFNTAIYFLLYAVFIQLVTEYVVDVVISRSDYLDDLLRIVVIVLQAMFFTLTTIGLFEAVYFYSNYSRAELEKAVLMRETLQSQFNTLKNQVSPHFLFNSLNTLSSLIAKDPAKAEEFVQEMSKVYRFLLKSNENKLMTLRDELSFIYSYLHLLKTRFGDNFQVSFQIFDHHHEFYIAPLTLQILIENAVKHNIISKAEPLRLTISSLPDNRLSVVNNLQKKTREVMSEKIGLSNIISKYKMLNHGNVEIYETTAHFSVIIPLIQTTSYESIYH